MIDFSETKNGNRCHSEAFDKEEGYGCEISGSHGDEYEHDYILGCCTV